VKKIIYTWIYIHILFFIFILRSYAQPEIPLLIDQCLKNADEKVCACLNEYLVSEDTEGSVKAYAYYYSTFNCDSLTQKQKNEYRFFARQFWDKINYNGYRYLNTYYYTIEEFRSDLNIDSLDHYTDLALSLPMPNGVDQDYLQSYTEILIKKSWAYRAKGDSQNAYTVLNKFYQSKYFGLSNPNTRIWFMYNFADILVDIPNAKYRKQAYMLHNESIDSLKFYLDKDALLNHRAYHLNKFGIGRFYEELDSIEKALNLFHQYYEYMSTKNDLKNMRNGANSISEMYIKKEDTKKAKKWLNTTLSFNVSNSDMNEFSHSPFVNYSKLSLQIGDVDYSKEILEKCIQYLYGNNYDLFNILSYKRNSIKYPIAYLDLITQIGNTFRLQNTPDSRKIALDYYQHAFRYFHELFYDVSYDRSRYDQKLDFQFLFQNLVSLTLETESLENVFSVLDQGKYSLMDYELRQKTKAFSAIGDNNAFDDNFNGAIIQYGSTSDSLIAVVLENNTYSLHHLAKTTELKSLVNKNLTLLRESYDDNKKNTAFRENSRLLYKLLIKPLKINSEAIKIIPVDYLALVPFESLLTSENDNQSFLIKKYSVSYSLSLTLDKLLQANKTIGKTVSTFTPTYKPNPNGDKAVERGAGIEETNLYDLTFAKEETNHINELYRTVKRLANKTEIFDAMAHDKVLHYSGHAISFIDAPDKSFLAFNSDIEDVSNFVTVTEIVANVCNNAMVVLSACDTGSGEIIENEGVLSLSRSFFQAGAKSVISTLWSVNDRSSSTIMKDFYSNLKSHSRKDQALRKAKLSYLQSTKDPNYKHPYYWAGFIAAGDMSSLQTPSNLLLYSFGMLLALLTIIILIRKKSSQSI